MLVFGWVLTTGLSGHVVKQTYGELKEKDGEWSLRLTFDIGLAEERPNDPLVPQKKRAYLLGLNEAEHMALQKRVRDVVRQVVIAKPSSYDVSFPGYAQQPYQFPELLSDGAYLEVLLRGKVGVEGLVLGVASDLCPRLVVSKQDQLIEIEKGEEKVVLDGKDGGEVEVAGAWDFIGIGFHHVLPLGWDHVLFVVGLCLGGLAWRVILGQSLLFTVAHSVTLGLTAADWLPEVGVAIEVVIALSIAGMGWLALRGKSDDGTPWVRYAVVFGFGLAHGVGFAGALSSSLDGHPQFLMALASMNIGVELAQVVVILGTLVVLRLSGGKRAGVEKGLAWMLVAVGLAVAFIRV